MPSDATGPDRDPPAGGSPVGPAVGPAAPSDDRPAPLAASSTTAAGQRDLLLAAACGLAVAASRVPFLSPGYGLDADGWRIVLAGRLMAGTGRYTVSRFPGYPVPEAAAALLHHLAPLAEPNLLLPCLTVLFSGIAAGLLTRLARAHGARPVDAAALATAFALTPAVFIQSVGAMDYLWAAAFTLGAWLAWGSGRAAVAGLAAGIAVACRPAALVVLLPALLLAPTTARARKIVLATGLAGLVILAAFLPALSRYGLTAARFSESVRPSLWTVLRLATVEVWGWIGVAALVGAGVAAGVGSFAARTRAGRSATASAALGDRSAIPCSARERTAWLLAAALAGCVFLRLPLEAGYLIPAVPFVLLAAGSRLPVTRFRLLCAALALSALVGFDAGVPAAGPVLADRTARSADARRLQRLLEAGEALPEGSVVVVGPRLLPKIKVLLPVEAVLAGTSSPLVLDPRFRTAPATNAIPAVDGARTWTAFISAETLESLVREGRPLWYAEGAREANRRRMGVELGPSARALERGRDSGQYPGSDTADGRCCGRG